MGVGFVFRARVVGVCGCLTENQKKSPPPLRGGGCRPKTVFVATVSYQVGGWGASQKLEACMCVFNSVERCVGVYFARKATTTMRWWLPPYVTVGHLVVCAYFSKCVCVCGFGILHCNLVTGG